MTVSQTGPQDTYTRAATAAITQAARDEHDFAGWLAGVLAGAAGRLGSSDALIAGRPGSWEASLVDQLVKGTVGYEDEYLPGPAAEAADDVPAPLTAAQLAVLDRLAVDSAARISALELRADLAQRRLLFILEQFEEAAAEAEPSSWPPPGYPPSPRMVRRRGLHLAQEADR
jgi:hypothetical protein